MHIFCHRSCAYEFLDEGPSDWMGRHFFSGGIMPSDELPLRFQEHLTLLRRDRWNGRHYEKTANAWLSNMDARKREHPAHSGRNLWRSRCRAMVSALADLLHGLR